MNEPVQDPEHKNPGPSGHKNIEIDGSSLDLQILVSVARNHAKVSLSGDAILQIQRNAELLSRLVQKNTPIYGVNTGFGVLASKKIPPSELNKLSRNLVLSHSVGVGEALPEDIVRAGILVRANTLAKGMSGIRTEVIAILLEILEKGVLPCIPSRGSLGSSGDLAPLAHLAQIISAHPASPNPSCSGKAWFSGKLHSGEKALAEAGIKPVDLGPKEGLALVNGAAFSAACLGLSLFDSITLLDAAEKAAILSFEALLGNTAALDSRIHAARQHPGQIKTASSLRDRLNGSTLVDSTDLVQDPYSLRCIPQVLGPVHEIIDFALPVLLREINAATDNPLIFDDGAFSGGNFHGQPISLAADYLKTAFCEVGAFSERRTYRLLSYEHQTGLPTMLVADPSRAGLQTGLMLLQYTAASLVLENQTLATPDSIHSLPTSAGQEDHNANSFNAVRNLQAILENLRSIIAIELLTAAEAIDIRMEQFPDRQPGLFARRLHSLIRNVAPATGDDDHPWSNYIEGVGALIKSGAIKVCN